MPASRTLEEIALSAPDPVRRAQTIMCVLLIEILHLLVASVTKTSVPPLRSNLLARLYAGETFDLPPELLSQIRHTVNALAALLASQHSQAPAKSATSRHIPPPRHARQNHGATRNSTPALYRRPTRTALIHPGAALCLTTPRPPPAQKTPPPYPHRVRPIRSGIVTNSPLSQILPTRHNPNHARPALHYL